MMATPNQNLIRLIVILFTLPKLYKKRLTHRGAEETKVNRDLYYSVLFAFSSAALGFLSTFMERTLEGKWLLYFATSGTVLLLLLLVLQHFIRSTHTIFVTKFHDDLNRNKLKISDYSKMSDDVKLELTDNFTLLSAEGYIDLALLILMAVTVLSYGILLVVNI